MKNRTVMAIFCFIAPIVTRIVNFFIPGRDSSVLTQECQNKCNIMTLVNGLQSYMDPEGKTQAQTIVDKCYALGSFPALWAIEGAGKDIAAWHLANNPSPTGILTGMQLDSKSQGAWLMLHAGAGMAFALSQIENLKDKSDGSVRRAVLKVVDLCRENSRPGYFGAAMESLGFVSRFLGNAGFCRQIHEVLTADAPDCVGFFWRGVGRAVYFHPINFMPGFVRPARAIRMCAIEAPARNLREAMLAGMAWAITVVNMRTPEVMEWILANHDDYFSGSPGFFNGVVASVVMRYDTTPEDPSIGRFRSHRPNAADRTLTGLWRSKITGSIEDALTNVYPALKAAGRLDEVFRFQPLPALAARLRRGTGS